MYTVSYCILRDIHVDLHVDVHLHVHLHVLVCTHYIIAELAISVLTRVVMTNK